MDAEEAKAKGYRRVSNKYRRVARIDREDWIDVLAEHLGRSPAQFFAPRSAHPEGLWCDYYRRVLSNDKAEMDEKEFHKVPSSDHDPVGFIR